MKRKGERLDINDICKEGKTLIANNIYKNEEHLEDFMAYGFTRCFARTERARGLDLSIFTTRQVTRL